MPLSWMKHIRQRLNAELLQFQLTAMPPASTALIDEFVDQWVNVHDSDRVLRMKIEVTHLVVRFARGFEDLRKPSPWAGLAGGVALVALGAALGSLLTIAVVWQLLACSLV